MVARWHGRGKGQPQALCVAGRGQVGPKSSSRAHFHVRGHEIGHLDEDLSEIGRSSKVLLGVGAMVTVMKVGTRIRC